MKSQSKSAFTLIEMLLVVAILGIIAAFVVSQLNIGGTQDKVNRDATRVQVQKVASAVNMFRLHTNRLPTNLNELAQNPGIEGWSGPYHKQFDDPFGTPLQYTVTGRTFVIRSDAGGTEGGPISSDDF
jgi:general secretion pathway protein G